MTLSSSPTTTEDSDPWYLVSYYTVDRIGCIGRTWYIIPVVVESRTSTAYTAPYKPRHEIRTGVARVYRISYMCSPSRKRPTREVELTGRGCFCDGCHIKHIIRMGSGSCKENTANNIRKYEPKLLWSKYKGTQQGPTKIAKCYDINGCHFDQHLISCLG